MAIKSPSQWLQEGGDTIMPATTTVAPVSTGIKSPSQWVAEGGATAPSASVATLTPTSGIQSPSDFMMEQYNSDLQTAQAKQPIISSLINKPSAKSLTPANQAKINEINTKLQAKKEGPSAAGTLFRKVGKVLSISGGVAAEEAEGLGNALGNLLKPLITKDISMPEANKRAAAELIQAQKDAWNVISGKTETSFSKKVKAMDWRQSDPTLKKTDAILGIGADLVLDPIWVIKPVKILKTIGEVTKLEKPAIALSKVLSKTKPVQWAKTIFSTATADKEFMAVVQKFRDLKQYREGKSLEQAVQLQKDLVKLEKTNPGINQIVTNALEDPVAYSAITDPAIKTIVDNLKLTYKTALEESRAVGLKVGEIAEYAPHIRTKESFLDQVKGGLGLGSKEFSKGAIEKGRKIEGTVAQINPQALIDRGVKLFEDNPAIQLVKKGQAYAKAITSKEFANTVAQFALKDGEAGVKVANPMLEGLNFLAEHARIIDNYYTGIKPEEINFILKGFDKIQNIWKAQALISPSYHIRNAAGNLWNNFLAGVNPFQYLKAAEIQMNPTKYATLIDEMKKVGVIDEGWYAKDIAEEVVNRVKGVKNWKAGLNPLSMQNYGFKGNRVIGSAVENNARIAHYLHATSMGKTTDEAAQSVKKFLFDYGDLTPVEKNVFKRFMPFYTWTSKNIPLQLSQLITQPAKFTVPYKIINDIENGVIKPNEKFMNDYLKNNIPIRLRTNAKGETEYFMLGQWLPYASMIDFLAQPFDNILGMVTPFIKNPIEFTTNTSLYFKNTFGDRSKIEAYPGQQGEYWTPATGKTLIKNKWLNVLRSIRVLNDVNRWIDSSDPTKTADSWQVKLMNTLVGKAATYNVQKSKYFYDKDTTDYIQGLENALKAALKKGYSGKDEVTSLRKRLIEMKKQRNASE